MLQQTIKQLAEDYYSLTVANRRFLHQHPELSYEENKTSAYIQERLSELGISFKVIANTGILAWVQGIKTSSGSSIALRSDIDALPIQEANDVSYRSVNKGVMHACGHDAHTASLITVAAILNQVKASFSGTIKLLFQPAEERAPGGAQRMIEGGALRNPAPQYVLGQHTMPELPAGKIGLRSGRYMASTDELFIKVHGKGGHAAMPHLTIDPVAISCELVSALQQIVSRASSPLVPSVLSFGKFIANGSSNVIPDEVEIEGTFRTLDEQWRAKVHDRLINLARSVVEGLGGTCSLEIRKGYPVLYNDENITNQVKQQAIDYLGEENVVDLDIWTASEDFAYYAQIVPSCFYRLGTGNKDKGITSGLHTPAFDIDEEALKTGPGLMAYLAVNGLNTLNKEDEKDTINKNS